MAMPTRARNLTAGLPSSPLVFTPKQIPFLSIPSCTIPLQPSSHPVICPITSFCTPPTPPPPSPAHCSLFLLLAGSSSVSMAKTSAWATYWRSVSISSDVRLSICLHVFTFSCPHVQMSSCLHVHECLGNLLGVSYIVGSPA